MRPETLQRRLYLSAVLLSLKERARFPFPPSPPSGGVANHRALEFFLKNTRVFSAGSQMQTRSTMRIRRPAL